MMTKDCINDLLMRGCDDWIQAAEVASVAIETGEAKSDSAIHEFSVELIQKVVLQGLMELGDLTSDGFHKWELPIAECLSRVEREWNALGRNPSLGEICWLQITDKGRELGEQLFEQRKSPP